MMNTESLCINNQWLDGHGEVLTSINPVDNTPVWQKACASNEQVIEAVTSAHQAQAAWAMQPLSKRIGVVEHFAELLHQHADELANAIAKETGKPDWEAATEVTAMANKAAISIRAQSERAAAEPQANDAPHQLAHRPHGVMAVFGPYNFPGHLPNGHIIPALLAGNAIVFKPSEQTPWVAEITTRLWIKAGLPAGVLNLVQGGREVGEALAQADINGLLFTGSSTVGKLLHRQMADRPEVLLALEMGGNNPLIVDSNVSIDTAVNTIIQSAYLSAGQRCTCARRLIVVENENTDILIHQLQQKLATLIVGAPDTKPEPFMGPVINQQTANALLDYQTRLVLRGATLLHDMTPDRAESNLLKPGLLDVTDVQERDDDEWFGPLLQIIRVTDFESALQEANNTRFGLAAGLISDKADHQHQFCARIKAGVISLNQPTAGASSAMPFGGTGASGNHRPSAYYAADYCAWPQAQSHGASTYSQTTPLVRGFQA